MNPDIDTMEKWEAVCREKKQRRLAIIYKLASGGVEFVDWENTYIDETVIIGKGTVVYPGVILVGATTIGEYCVIGHNTRIEDSTIGDGVNIQSSEIMKSTVGDGTKVGPFAYIRPDSHIGKNAKIGDFVEVKNSTIGDGTKASHLTYIGDSDLGSGINLGCGVVFVNYDGSSKHRCTVENGAFIGCNTNLVAPVNVGESAYVAAGTTLTRDVPNGALAVGRAKQENLEGWVEKRGLLKKKDK